MGIEFKEKIWRRRPAELSDWILFLIAAIFILAAIFLILFFYPVSIAQAKLGDYAGKTETERYMDTYDEIFKRLHQLEVQTDQLEQQNRALEAKIGAVSIPKQETIVKEVQTQVVVQDEARMVAVEKRIGALEQAYNFIQKNVMEALSKTIGLLTKLLSR